MKKFGFAVAVLLVVGTASMRFADDTRQKSDATKTTDVKGTAVAKGEKPKASPGWVVIEEDWAYPLLYDFSTSLHNAREHDRAKEERSAAAEIDKAISWRKYAESHAARSVAEDLATARSDLMDFSASLRSGKPVMAKKLDAAFAQASVALAKQDHFQTAKALGESELKTAGRHLLAATDLLRCAAQSASAEFGSEAVMIADEYAPFGYRDDAIVFGKGKLEANLTTIKTELEKLAAKLKATREFCRSRSPGPLPCGWTAPRPFELADFGPGSIFLINFYANKDSSMARLTEHAQAASVVRVVEMVGESKVSWEDAARLLVSRESQTNRHITGLDLIRHTAVVKDGKISRAPPTPRPNRGFAFSRIDMSLDYDKWFSWLPRPGPTHGLRSTETFKAADRPSAPRPDSGRTSPNYRRERASCQWCPLRGSSGNLASSS